MIAAFELREGGLCDVAWVGRRRVEPSPLILERETVFDWASLTKPLCTAPLIWRAVQRGWLAEDTCLNAVLTDAPSAWGAIRIGHLLSHSAGFRAWAPVWQELQKKWGSALPGAPIRERQSMLRALVMRETLEAAPGQRTLYSDFSFLLLGFVLEQLHGESLSEIWDREMGESGATFKSVLRSGRDSQPSDLQCAATENSPWRGGWLQGEVHDENCWSMGGYAGHAGLFGGMTDLITVTRRIFDSRYLDPRLRARMLGQVLGPEGPARTLGWDIPSGPDSSVGPTLAARRGVVGHLGFTGTSLWVDQESGWAFSALTNRVHFGREHVGIRSFRPRIHDAMAQDVLRDLL